MKILYFTDVHGSEAGLSWVKENGGDFEAILVGGDITQRGDLGFTERFLRMLSRFNVPVLFVPGNSDPKGLAIPSNVTSLHGRRAKLGSLVVGGLGGSNRTPFGTPFELSDGQAKRILDSIGSVDVLLSHCPPYGTKCDTTANEESIGSKPVRSYIEKNAPLLVLSGHVHEARSVDKIQETVIVNPGPLMFGNYAVADLTGGVRVELKNDELHPTGNPDARRD
jgi:Icc-related predicted phosphoesterase